MEIENVSPVEEQSADQPDAFLEGWGDETPEAAQEADQPGAQAEGTQEETGKANAEPETEGAAADAEENGSEPETRGKNAGEDPAQPEQEQAAAPVWTIKHMGQERTFSAADITQELLQKGLDYDRVRGKYDEAKPVMELFGQFARQANMSLADYVRHIRAQAKKAGGMSDEEAARIVELEDREAAVSAKENEQREGAKNEEDRKARVAADLAEFQNAFPDIFAKAKEDPGAIPQSVWNEVSSGKLSLTAAYSRYAVAQANEAVRAAREAQQTAAQNQRNTQRSTGSLRSAGSDTGRRDAFLEGFGN